MQPAIPHARDRERRRSMSYIPDRILLVTDDAESVPTAAEDVLVS